MNTQETTSWPHLQMVPKWPTPSLGPLPRQLNTERDAGIPADPFCEVENQTLPTQTTWNPKPAGRKDVTEPTGIPEHFCPPPLPLTTPAPAPGELDSGVPCLVFSAYPHPQQKAASNFEYLFPWKPSSLPGAILSAAYPTNPGPAAPGPWVANREERRRQQTGKPDFPRQTVCQALHRHLALRDHFRQLPPVSKNCTNTYIFSRRMRDSQPNNLPRIPSWGSGTVA